MVEVRAHQRFHLTGHLVVGRPEHRCGRFLQLVGQHVEVASDLHVQDRAEPEQEVLGLVDPPDLDPDVEPSRRILELRDHPHRGNVAQRARRVLDVGFEVIQRPVELAVPLLEQVAEGRQHRAPPGGARSLAQRRELLEERGVPVEVAGLEQRDQELGVVGVGLRQVGQLADVVPDVEAQVPEGVQHRPQEALLGRAERAAEHEQQVDVRVHAQLPPPVAAQRHHGDGGVGLTAGRPVDQPHQIVDAVRIAAEARQPAARAQRVRGQLVAGRLEHPAQRLGCGRRRRLLWCHLGSERTGRVLQ